MKTKWINFKTKSPKDYERVIYWDARDGGNPEIGYFVTNQTPPPDYVTHWMPSPKKPRGVVNRKCS